MTSESSHYNKADTNLYHAIHSDLVGELLHPPRPPPTPELVRRFRHAHYADPGARTYHWGVANDNDNNKPDQIHGTKFGTTSLAGEVVNPPVLPRPRRLLAAVRRLTYDSTVGRPVGCAPLRQLGIPPHLARAGAATFGVPTKYGDTVAQCIGPFRTAEEFQANWCEGTNLYKRSHHHLNPGEQVHRSYGPGFDSTARFGAPTPADGSGRRLKECVTWPDPCQRLPAIVSVRADNYRDLSQHRVGQTLDRFQCTRHLPADFTYGSPMRHVLSGALDVATARTSCNLPAEDLARLDLILATRRRLQAAGYTSFIALMQTMKNMDKLGTKHLPLESVLAACSQRAVPLPAAELRQLVHRLNLAHGPRQLVIYSLLVATINWKDRLTIGHLDLLRREQQPVAERPSSSSCQPRPPLADCCGERPAVSPPSVYRPHRHRLVDVVRPSPFIEAGLPESELTMPRSEPFLMELLCGMGVCDHQQFRTLYSAAKAKNPTDPSVLDILDTANSSCCLPDAATDGPQSEPEACRRHCAAGIGKVGFVAKSGTCRGTDQQAIVPPPLDGGKKLRFAESTLEASGEQLPWTDAGSAAEFLRPTPEDSIPPRPPSVTGGQQPSHSLHSSDRQSAQPPRGQ